MVFVNGVFDLLHPGHVEMLEYATEWSEDLVIGLNSDESVKRLKGPTRPILPQEARRYLLKSLWMEPSVFLFHEDTPVELIKVLQPQYIVKGMDYVNQYLPEREVVESYGGQILFAPYNPQWSTTKLIAKL